MLSSRAVRTRRPPRQAASGHNLCNRTPTAGIQPVSCDEIPEPKADGTLKLLGTAKRRGAPMNPDTKDLIVSRDGKYLYAVGSGTKEIAVFKIGADRLLTELSEGKSPLKLSMGQNITGLVAD